VNVEQMVELAGGGRLALRAPSAAPASMSARSSPRVISTMHPSPILVGILRSLKSSPASSGAPAPEARDASPRPPQGPTPRLYQRAQRRRTTLRREGFSGRSRESAFVAARPSAAAAVEAASADRPAAGRHGLA